MAACAPGAGPAVRASGPRAPRGLKIGAAGPVPRASACIERRQAEAERAMATAREALARVQAEHERVQAGMAAG